MNGKCNAPIVRAASMAAAIMGALRPGSSALGLLGALAAFAVCSTARASNTFYVNTTGDPGPPETLSLRQAVALSAKGDDILFDASLMGSTITLTQGAISIDHLIFIQGFSGPRTVIISGANTDRIFYIVDGSSLFANHLHLTQGHTTGCGGAIYAKNGGVFLSESSVTGSVAAFGGGVCIKGTGAGTGLTNAIIGQSHVSGNSALLGGGLYLGNSGNVSVVQSTISGNSALSAGGGIYAAGVDTLSVTYSLISANTVPAPSEYSFTSQGGGMVVAGIAAQLKIMATTIAGNSAFAAGGAIRFLDGPSVDRTKLVNVTVAGNASGGGAALSTSAGTMLVESTIVANNPGGDLAGTFNASYSLIKNPSGAQISGSLNLFGTDPQLAPLADRGGFTFCMLPAPDSPVIDAGKLPSAATSDQRGFPIVGLFKDIGAVERQNPEDIVFRDGFDAG